MGRLFLGMDGGGSNARARLVDGTGRWLGEGRGGPANIGSDPEGAVMSLEAAVSMALATAGLAKCDRADVVAVIGAAGAADPGMAARLIGAPFGFGRLRVVTDAEIALEGAFAGGDGGIVIVGTGSQAYGRLGDRRIRVGGWGAALSDGGSGVLIGRNAARRALEAYEGLAAPSPMTATIFDRLGGSGPALSAFGKTARPSDWAALAPVVFDYAEAGDAAAGAIIAAAVAEIEALIGRLAGEGIDRIALVGGLASSYLPRLSSRFACLIAEPAGDALDGALSLARRDASE
ncbi:BadF/BadG/BcrA/BcrD ATPase family protein [Pleomorphomonas sp. JP5]|uniref:BadF/BadG/BcrA/BcrD ATPase family protein n=1 Tax=Pleomorphomonas sp. JP5 TaxID=2942998 RepID=UPI002044543C|nr:BadF/BadG/BcrA/BcrD ATPase family protein [Pleomorphomonas sp. JP5]MCM5559603.1 N-acetylglucosamine kinase [Pleomorphomonas sp. JP5]